MKTQVLHIDQALIRTANVQGEIQGEILNSFIAQVETQLKTSFSDEEKVKLKDNAEGFLRTWIKQFYQFPNSTDEFNLQALGVDLEGIIRTYRTNSKNWEKYPYLLEEGVFKLDSEAVQERYTKYTTNEFQNDALEIAQELIKLVEKAQLKGILNTDPHTSIRIVDAFRVLALQIQSDKGHNLIVNPAITNLGKITFPLPEKEMLEAVVRGHKKEQEQELT